LSDSLADILPADKSYASVWYSANQYEEDQSVAPVPVTDRNYSDLSTCSMLLDTAKTDLQAGNLCLSPWFRQADGYYTISLDLEDGSDGWRYLTLRASEQSAALNSALQALGISISTEMPDYSTTFTHHSRTDTLDGVPMLDWGSMLLQLTLANPDAANVINSDLFSDYIQQESTYDAMQQTATEDYKSRVSGGFADSWSAYQYRRQISLGRVDQRVVSVLYEDFSYTGGAHGNTAKLCANYDAQTGARLTLSDLCEDTETFRAYLTDQLKEITASPAYEGMLFDGYTDALDQVISEDTWYFSDTGLVLVAGQYLIAPFAAGILEFTIPYDQLIGLMDSAWLPDGV
ncbi:MAG: DUF3298 domain-containing protein, partial [Oscillospiraceae bacterium]|nr:DUF3298 domain-containing protein [Oscillospiraceae bacterium]